jgi:hypothetical protein
LKENETYEGKKEFKFILKDGAIRGLKEELGIDIKRNELIKIANEHEQFW